MNNSPLVSLIIPCYNGENTLQRCLDSILNQTYKNLEVIIVNDGSEDKTEEVILSYNQKFEKEGISLIYIHQENKGLGGAINAGLERFSGDYLCWFDCDDFLFPDSVRIRLEYLESHPEYGVATSDACIYNHTDLDNSQGLISDWTTDKYNPYQFMLLLRGESIFCSGCHMVRTEAFLDMVPTKQIYPARRGQNWQMLLPVYYKYKRAYIDTPLYGYVIYKGSMSKGDYTKEQKIKRFREHLDIVTNTLNRMPISVKEKRKYKQIYKGIYARNMYRLGASAGDYLMALRYFILLVFSKESCLPDIKQIFNHFRKNKNK